MINITIQVHDKRGRMHFSGNWSILNFLHKCNGRLGSGIFHLHSYYWRPSKNKWLRLGSHGVYEFIFGLSIKNEGQSCDCLKGDFDFFSMKPSAVDYLLSAPAQDFKGNGASAIPRVHCQLIWIGAWSQGMDDLVTLPTCWKLIGTKNQSP